MVANSYDGKITKALRSSQQNNLETDTNKHEERKKEERRKIIDDLRLT